jgi:glycosyltransferase involved in cell wall biosynthesis
MRLCITTELRVERTPDSAIWTTTAMAYDFWRRYLSVFDEIRVIGRVHDVERASASWKRANGEGVEFFGLPYYVGPKEFLRKRRSVARAVRAAIDKSDAMLFRVSSPIAACARPVLRGGRPHGLEIVGDPYDVFAPGSVDHAFRPFFRFWFTEQLKRQCRAASVTAFVTERTLQERYPPNPKAFTTNYSSVELPEHAFAAAPKRFPEQQPSPLRILSIGSMEQRYKGFDVLIHAITLCRAHGMPIQLVLVGDGRYRTELVEQTRRSGVSDIVYFRGNLPGGESVRAELDAADLFVLPSKTEGLPRVMIEAMARGLACLGSDVGGIPELLSNEDLVPVADAQALAAKIELTFHDPERMNRMAERNFRRARDYQDCKVNARRIEFLKELRTMTEAWNDWAPVWNTHTLRPQWKVTRQV